LLDHAPTVQGSLQRRVEVGDAIATCATYAPGVRYGWHAHDRPTVTLIVAGELEEEYAGGRVRAGPGHIVVKPAGVPHANHYGPRPVVAVVLEPREEGAFDDALRHSRYEWSPASPMARPLFGLLKLLRGAPDGAGGAAACVADALALLLDPARRPGAGPPRWMAAVEEYLSANLAVRPSVPQAAAVAGVHPVHLARAFRRFHGMSVVAFVQRARLREAARLLSSTRLDAAEIAQRVGCCDQAYMSRLFSRHWSLAPGQYRRAAMPDPA